MTTSLQDINDLRWASWQLEILRFTQRLNDNSHLGSNVDLEREALMTVNESEYRQLKIDFDILNTKLRESQSQRAILESVISERLSSERVAISNANELKQALLRVTSKCSELTEENHEIRKQDESIKLASGKREARLVYLEEKLLEVEAFMDTEHGVHLYKLESELAEAKLVIAELESEKDELEQQLAFYEDNLEESHELLDSLEAESAMPHSEETSVVRMPLTTLRNDENRNPNVNYGNGNKKIESRKESSLVLMATEKTMY